MSQPIDSYSSRILIVDDQQTNVRLLEYALRRGGYVEVSSTVDPVEVCDLHRQNPYDLIILDLRMPRMNGLQVLEGLRRIDGAQMVAVLIVSADPSQAVRARELGARGFITKPFDFAEVLQRVTVMLEENLLRDTARSAAPLVSVPAA